MESIYYIWDKLNKLVLLLIKIVNTFDLALKKMFMRILGPQAVVDHAPGFYLVQPESYPFKRSGRHMAWVFLLIVLSNVTTYLILTRPGIVPNAIPEPSSSNELYLLEEAGFYIEEVAQFEEKVRRVAVQLDVPPEWLMSVMYMESRFNPAVSNYRGSGAVGLIQFMVPAVKELNKRMGTKYYMRDIKQMSANRQLDLVYSYLQMVQERYGEFNSLTDLYLGILYPRAMGKAYCHELFAHPSRAYRQNKGLDENRDGKVTVSDIDKRMRRLFPEAYLKRKRL